MWVAGTPLGPTGGHGDAANGLDPELEHPGWTDNLIDSPEAARRTVRRLRREGADLIKIMPSGGVMSIGDDPKLQLMEDDEIKAVIETAHSLGMKVAAHAHGKQAIDHTHRAGRRFHRARHLRRRRELQALQGARDLSRADHAGGRQGRTSTPRPTPRT